MNVLLTQAGDTTLTQAGDDLLVQEQPETCWLLTQAGDATLTQAGDFLVTQGCAEPRGTGGGGEFGIGAPSRYRDLLEMPDDDDEELLEILAPIFGHVLQAQWVAYLRQTQSNR